MFEFKSVEFTTQALMNKEKKRLVNELCEFLGIERENFRLQQGSITIYGLTKEGNWLPISSYISDFKEILKRKSYVSFKLETRLQVQK